MRALAEGEPKARRVISRVWGLIASTRAVERPCSIPAASPSRCSVIVRARLVPALGADLVERVGGELHDVEGVDAAHRGGEPLGGRAGDPGGHVTGQQFDLFAALFAERVEERLDRLAVAAGGRPDEPARV